MLRPDFFLWAKWKLFLICIKGNVFPLAGSSFFPYPAFSAEPLSGYGSFIRAVEQAGASWPPAALGRHLCRPNGDGGQRLKPLTHTGNGSARTRPGGCALPRSCTSCFGGGASRPLGRTFNGARGRRRRGATAGAEADRAGRKDTARRAGATAANFRARPNFPRKQLRAKHRCASPKFLGLVM